jgi:hypothetical protein
MDVGLRVEFIPFRDAAAVISLEHIARTASASGTFTSPAELGSVRITCDNTYSYWHDKDVTVTFEIQTANASAADSTAASSEASISAPHATRSAHASSDEAVTPSTAGLSMATSTRPVRRAPRGFELHPLLPVIAESCSLSSVNFDDYFGMPISTVSSAYGLSNSAINPTAVFVVPPSSKRFGKSFSARVAMAQVR